jgi:O-antigen ligase
MNKKTCQDKALYFLLGALFFTPISAYAAIPLVLISLMLFTFSKPELRLNFLDKLQFILLGTMFLSSIFAVHKRHSFYASCALVSYILVYFLAKELINKKEHIEKFIKTLAALVILVSAIGIIQYITDYSLVYKGIPIVARDPDNIRIASICYNALILSSFLLFGLPILISFSIEEKSNKFLLVSAILGTIAFFLTYSRGPIVAFIFSLSILLFIKKKRFIAFTLPFIIVVIVFLTPYFRARFFHAFQEGANMSRIRGLKVGIEMWKKNSIFTGVGIHNFYLLFEKYCPPGHRRGARYVHNMYINFLVEAGILGLAALLFVFGTAIKSSRDIYFRLNKNLKNNEYEKWVSEGLFASLIGITIHNLVDNTIYVVGLGMLFWIGMGIVSGIYSKTKTQINH